MKHLFTGLSLAAVFVPSLVFASFEDTARRADEYFQSDAYRAQQQDIAAEERAKFQVREARAIHAFATRFHGGLVSFDQPNKEFSTTDSNDCKYAVAPITAGWAFTCINRVTFNQRTDIDSEEYLLTAPAKNLQRRAHKR